jgi:hypothetical protein
MIVLGGAARMTVPNNGYYREARTGGVCDLGTTSKCFVSKIQTNWWSLLGNGGLFGIEDDQKLPSSVKSWFTFLPQV